MRNTALFTTLFLLPTAAMASTILGNPSSGVVLLDDAEVYVDHIIAVECVTLNQTQIDIDTTLEELESAQVQLTADVDYCELTVHLKWTPSAPVDPVTVDGFTKLSTGQTAPAVEIELHAGAQTATLVQ